MGRVTSPLAVLPKGSERTARVDLPFGAHVDDITSQLEGYKRRTKDGYRFTDSPHNVALVRKHFPKLEIEFPPDFTRKAGRQDIPIGTYAGPKDRPLYAHQQAALDASWDATEFAYFMEQGTGKTRVAIEKMGYHYGRGELTGVLVITFKGIHKQWVETQIPEHIGTIDGEEFGFYAAAWDTKIKTALFSAFSNAIPVRGLEILTINFEALNGDDGQTLVEAFCWRHQGALMIVVDESHAIKQYDTRRSHACCELAKLARFKLIMSGTPIPMRLEDEWAQTMFLSEAIFGFRYVTTFRSIYVGRNGEDRRIDEFRDVMQPYSYRVTKDEALDLPPKIYEQYKFDLSPVAQKAYRELQRNFLTTIPDEHRAHLETLLDSDAEQSELPDDLTFTVQNHAVMLLRLQQIACGRLVNEDGTTIKISSDRENALKELLPRFDEQRKIIIWTRFRQDVKDIMNIVPKFGKATQLVGSTPPSERWDNANAFLKDRAVKFLITNPAVGGTGYNFQGDCQTNIYYTNSYNSVHRWQSEDRTHRIGTHHPVSYIDLIAHGTIDNGILANLQGKKDFAALVLDVMRGLQT